MTGKFEVSSASKKLKGFCEYHSPEIPKKTQSIHANWKNKDLANIKWMLPDLWYNLWYNLRIDFRKTKCKKPEVAGSI